ncbi:MAG TPA: hypothetical protein VFN35_28340, partial [Ktedonobacteraceae bacterium]|nr:hypothetical protein [Ktedonobacteraceae bacterium]
LGDFLNYWYGYATDRRMELVREAIQVPENVTPELFQWAVFCAASVEYLCRKYGIVCPEWVESYSALPEPWFKGLGASKPHVQDRLRGETPEPFARRNIYCSPKTFANKYELAEQRQPA